MLFLSLQEEEKKLAEMMELIEEAKKESEVAKSSELCPGLALPLLCVVLQLCLVCKLRGQC